MKKILSEKIFRYSYYFAIFWLVSLIPLIKFLPNHLAYENSLIENIQLFLLFIGVLIAAFNFKKCTNVRMKRAWLSVCAGMLLMMGREVSWGRVFFLRGYNSDGYPLFYEMKDIPGHELIHAVIGIFLVFTVLGVIFYFPWKKLVAVMPKKHVCFLMIFMLLTYCENSVGLATTGEKIKMEELSEVGFYFLADIILLYYSKYFGRFERQRAANR